MSAQKKKRFFLGLTFLLCLILVYVYCFLSASRYKHRFEKETVTELINSIEATTRSTATTEYVNTTTENPCGPNLMGRIELSFTENNTAERNWPPTLEEIAVDNPKLKLGGFYPGPDQCQITNRLAIIVPFRDREEHLRYFLHYMHLILQHQQSAYKIYVLEQDNDDVFNKGQLMNTGFLYAINDSALMSNCVFFHDVDVISEDDRTIYKCQENKVAHLPHRLDKYNYTFCCGVTVGGALGFTPTMVKAINGFSNAYYGWGGEDDDVNYRIQGKFKVFRPQEEYARFRMVSHKRDDGNPLNSERHKLLSQWRTRQTTDGLNSLQTNISRIVRYKTHTRIYVKTKPKE